MQRMRIVADNDVIGAVAALQRRLESDEWAEFSAALQLEFVDFAALGLSRDASDRTVWQACQNSDVLLVTGNRTGGSESLDAVIRGFADADSLPVVTIADPRRVLRDAEYAERCVISLLDYMERIDSLRGTGRLFLP